MTLQIKFKKLTEDAITPTRAYGYGNCWDIYANEDVTIHSFESTLVPTGLAFEIPQGYQVHLYSRSSNPLKNYLILSNSVGIVDMTYVGHIQGIFHTLPDMKDISQGASGTTIPEFVLVDRPIKIEKGQKILQMKLVKIEDEELEEVSELTETTRGENGFGSSGNK